MAEKTIILDVGPSGEIQTIYKDEINQFAEKIGGEISTVCRASNVEWEAVEKPINARFPSTKGWSVRAVYDPNLALRIKSSYIPSGMLGDGPYVDEIVCSREEHLAIALFDSRERAIEFEVKHFFDLLPPRQTEKRDP